MPEGSFRSGDSLSDGAVLSREVPTYFAASHLISAACLLVTAQAWLIAKLGFRAPGPVLSESIQLALGILCILACTEALRRSRGVTRNAWQLLTATFTVWAVAQALGTYLDISGNHTLDGYDDLLFFLSVIPFGMLPFLDQEGEPNHFDRLHLLDFVQVGIFWVSIVLCFSPRVWSPETAFRIGHFTWSRTIAFDGVLVATFVIRAWLTTSKSVRSLFARMAIFVLFSGMADSYAISPGQDLPAGGWFDLIWSALLVIPILITATWKNGDKGRTDASRRSQKIVVNQVFPLLYPLISFLLLAHVDRAYPVLSPVVFVFAFIALAARVLIIQHRQAKSEANLLLDVAERERTEEALRKSETQYRLLFDINALPMWVFDRETLKFLEVNAAAIRHYGFSQQEFLAMTLKEIRPEEEIPDLLKATAQRKHGLQEPEIWKHRKKDGTVIDVEIVSHDLDFHGIEAELVSARDVTERKRSEEGLLFKTALLEAQAETTIDGILVIDEANHIILANKQFGLHFGIPDELLSTRDDLVVREHVTNQVEDPDAFVEKIEYLNGHRYEKSRDELKLKNGKIFDRYSAPLVDAKDRHRGRIWYFRDITDHKIAQERVQHLAYYDALTGLPNRTLLKDRLAKALAAARRRKDKVALLFVDLDRFKFINDSLGHNLGDVLLQEVAERLKRWAREQDTVARLGGDEFLIVLNDVKNIPDVAIAAERLMDAMAHKFVVQGHSLDVSCSLGISIYPEHGADSETLIKHADAAMYSAKDDGRNNFRFFTDEMNAEVVERLNLEHGLRQALNKKELFLVYQPQMDIASGRITGLEALLRWQHPELGLVPPDKFIPIAENSGLIGAIGEWVLRAACSQARRWQDEGLPAVTVAVNVSAVQFRQANFCEIIKGVLCQTGLAPQYLELELTESLLLSGAEATLTVLRELEAMGLKLAIDDFGTGYSSLSYLKHFPVGKLKIDRSFIRDVGANPDDMAITSAIIGMAKSLNLKVIAEGVENETQLSFLRAHQCDEIQGYYFSKPLTLDKISEKLRCSGLSPGFQTEKLEYSPATFEVIPAPYPVQ